MHVSKLVSFAAATSCGVFLEKRRTSLDPDLHPVKTRGSPVRDLKLFSVDIRGFHRRLAT